jgi:hypothetical protein
MYIVYNGKIIILERCENGRNSFLDVLSAATPFLLRRDCSQSSVETKLKPYLGEYWASEPEENPAINKQWICQETKNISKRLKAKSS